MPTLKELLAAGVHFGHRSARWNPKMAPYIFTEKGGIHIINLEKTLEKLEEASNYLAKASSEGKTILFVGTKKQAVEIVKKAAISCGMPYVVERWPGGLLTNFEVVKKSIEKMVSMRITKETEEFKKINKKEQSLFKVKLAHKENLFSGLADLRKKPDIVLIIDVPGQKIAVKELAEAQISLVGLADTNANPEVIDYLIPANDDATKSLELMAGYLAGVIAENKPKVV